MIHFEPGEIAIIMLDNPERHNALSHEDFARMGEILDALEKDPARVVILTATGKSFCAGVEFQSLQTGDWASNNPLNALCERVSQLPMPVIAALNGSFVGGGAELAFCADVRISVPHAKCKVPAAAISVHYEPTGIERVVGVVGLQIARRLFLGLEVFAGEDLLRFHFVDEFADDPMVAAQEYAKRMARLAPLALSGMKASLNVIRDHKDDHQSRARIVETFSSQDFAEAMEAVVMKRAPDFKGR